ncbi:MAG: hypothetical protein E7019_05020 [Alphaproteobacteria bacterium]|nr:hypothetical protein [Alphaproteobacteria bacterium]
MLTISEAPVSAAEGCEQAQIATDSAQYAYNSASSDLYKAKTNAKNAFEEATRLRNIADKSGLSADKARADEAAVKEQEAEKTAKDAYAKGATYAKETAEAVIPSLLSDSLRCFNCVVARADIPILSLMTNY